MLEKLKPSTLPDSASGTVRPSRFITAASLFDGHDAAINLMRRILQDQGVEVIHLGHNRSVEEIVTAALQEDSQAIAVSSYQGGHMEFFKYMVDMLRARGGEAIRVFAGGGGVIVPEEIRELQDYGVTRVYSPEDGQAMGLEGMIREMIELSVVVPDNRPTMDMEKLSAVDWKSLAHFLTALENDTLETAVQDTLHARAASMDRMAPVLGITGTGGAGKSSLTDELILRFRLDQQDRLKIALIAVDPSRRRTGGALLGDRIRMNAIHHPNIYMRSIATRSSTTDLPAAIPDMIAACRVADFDLIVVETPGIGQGSTAISDLVDISLYVMTPEYGAQSQLEKIDMLDFADVVAINKFDRKGSRDAYRDVCKQVQRNRKAYGNPRDQMPVFGTLAARFNDDGVTALYHDLVGRLSDCGLETQPGTLHCAANRYSTDNIPLIAPGRTRYLSEIAATVREYKARVQEKAAQARECQQLLAAKALLEAAGEAAPDALESLAAVRKKAMGKEARELLAAWPERWERYRQNELMVQVRDRETRHSLARITLSGTRLARVALPSYADQGDLLQWLMLENLPGSFPFTAGVFPLKRESEAPTRMFAGEGDAFRTNRRFHHLSSHSTAKRLSTAFDSVTLYGCDPNERPDIYGKVGNSGVSIATLEDMKALYDGFDLCDPQTSVSMTINGPAPIILAMFLNAAIDQQLHHFQVREGRTPNEDETELLRQWTLENVRGTVQADILKEDQGQNTCIFSTEFALKLMGDIQEYFVEHRIRNFYSVSISGYHIAEAGANPISQLAFTLSNGFTFVESYLARGMQVNAFAPNFSFFFSNGMDPEYTVMGRVARRIWAVAMRERYGADERSQKLKYHIQTSGRSLHAQEMDFNDIRTTLQALIAVYDHCNSLHTNAYDEAVTTPTEESVRRALAIQLIINQEWGLAGNENPNQGSFIMEELTELVEEAVLMEFERICERGGVLGAMESGYQRGKIQDESMEYEHRKHDKSLPIIGVNTFQRDEAAPRQNVPLARSSHEEKQSQIERLQDFHQCRKAHSAAALQRIRLAVLENRNIFAELMDAVRYCSLGQISETMYQVGGQYRRNM